MKRKYFLYLLCICNCTLFLMNQQINERISRSNELQQLLMDISCWISEHENSIIDIWQIYCAITGISLIVMCISSRFSAASNADTIKKCTLALIEIGIFAMNIESILWHLNATDYCNIMLFLRFSQTNTDLMTAFSILGFATIYIFAWLINIGMVYVKKEYR